MNPNDNDPTNWFSRFLGGQPAVTQQVPGIPNFDATSHNLMTNPDFDPFTDNIPGTQMETIQPETGGLLGGEFGSMQGWGQLLGGIGDIGSAYMAYKNFGLAEDQFDFTKLATNRNLANQATTTNSALRSQNRARNRLGGGDRTTAQVDGSPL